MTNADVARRIAELMPREARWAYFQRGRGPMFVYNTERINERFPTRANGMFESAIFEPIGKGSRSGKAVAWKVRADSRSLHTLRRDAKARAYRLYREWLESQ